MKILALCQALDLSIRDLGITPAWWQVLKGFHEVGVDVVATSFYGRSVESLWWKAIPNPSALNTAIYHRLEGSVSDMIFNGDRMRFRQFAQPVLTPIGRKFTTRRLKALLARVLRSEHDIDALLVLTVPLNLIGGVATMVKNQFGIPIIFYDGDTPSSLPSYGGLSISFYTGADLSEYDAFIINSGGGKDDLRKLGAQRVETIYWGVDPTVYTPVQTDKQDFDVAFYGVGSRFREDAMNFMLTKPSNQMPDIRFAASGGSFSLSLGRTKRLEAIRFRELSSRAKINLNIVRRPHASVYASSITRPFELASMGCCIVSNPQLGMEEWFKIDQEIYVAQNSDEAIELYKWLLESEKLRRETGLRARERVLKEHTHLHRASQIVDIINSIRK